MPCSSVWDPYQYNKIYIIDRMQRRATCWSLYVYDYDRYSSVTLMQHQLNWQNLQQCQKIARLLLLYKALYDHITLQIPPYYAFSYSNTRPEQITSFHSFILEPGQISICTVSIQKLSNNGIVFHQIWHQLNLQQNFIN